MLDELRRVFEYKEFLLQFTLQQLKTRYRGSVLGFFWTLLNPTLTCLALSVVFSYINKWDLRTAGLFFFSGYIPWLFFVGSATSATVSIIGNANYVSRIYVPRAIFPISTVLVYLTDLIAGVLVVIAYRLLVGAGLNGSVAFLPLSMIVMTFFMLGVAFLFATVNVFLRDFQFLWAAVSFLWFFFTPILYPLEAIPEGVRPYLAMNPVLPFIRLFQEPLCGGTLPSPETFATALLVSGALLGVGVTAFFRSERSFYLYI